MEMGFTGREMGCEMGITSCGGRGILRFFLVVRDIYNSIEGGLMANLGWELVVEGLWYIF